MTLAAGFPNVTVLDRVNWAVDASPNSFSSLTEFWPIILIWVFVGIVFRNQYRNVRE